LGRNTRVLKGDPKPQPFPKKKPKRRKNHHPGLIYNPHKGSGDFPPHFEREIKGKF